MVKDTSDRTSAETSDATTDSTSEEENGAKKKMQFSSSFGFVVSLLGYSMGTSDFWRFPYLVFRNGGGAFLIPFILTMVLCGIPLFFLEVSMSQFSGKGSLALWDLAPFFKGIGFTLLCINVVNNVYYNILRAWILQYFVSSFHSELPWQSCSHHWNRAGCIQVDSVKQGYNVTGSMTGGVTSNATMAVPVNVTKMTAAEQYWQYEVLQLSSGIDDLGSINWYFVLYIFIWRVIVGLCMIKSIKSIEKVMYVTVFVPILLMIGIWVRTLTLDGAVDGILYYITPSFNRLADHKVWLEAALMACYTLGPGWGTLPVIGSHNRFSSNCLRHSIVTTVFDCLSAVMNGLICFTILGVMSHNSGLDLEKTVTSGMSLGFTVYPTALTFIPLPQFWSALFFLNLILVGLDAQVLSTETVMNILEDLIPSWFVRRRRLFVIALVNVLAFLLTIPFCTQGGMYIFQLLDWYAVAWSILFVAFVECIVFTWVYGNDRVSRDVEIMLGRPLPALLRFNSAVITPIVLVILLVLSFVKYTPPTYGTYRFPRYSEVLGWCLAVAIVSPILINFVWRWLKSEGSSKQRLLKIVTPSVRWQPSDEVSQVDYHDTRLTNRSFFKLFVYNTIGRRREVTKNVNNGVYHTVPMVEQKQSGRSGSYHVSV